MKDWGEFEKSLQAYNPDLVGLSFASPIAHLGFKAAEIVKKVWPDSFTVAGGPHSTIEPSQTVKNEFIDVVIVGEGEIALARLVAALAAEGNLEDVPGIWYQKKGQIVHNERRELISNLDDLPYPDLNIIDIERYIRVTRTMPIHVSRGCPFNCFFCQPTQRKLFGLKVRFRSPDNIVGEMQDLREKYPQKNYIFSFQADTFTTSKKWVLELCDKIVANKLQGIPWIADSRVNTIDEQTIRAMRSAGCISIRFGIESGSQRILNFLNKGIKVAQSKNALRLCYENNIIPQAYIMTGIPTETKEDLEMTCGLIRDAHPAFVNISKATPVPGSNMYDYVLERGMSNISEFLDFDYYHNEYPIALENLTREDLKASYTKMMNVWLRSFITHPSFVVQFLKLLRRFPGYRLFFIRYIMRGLRTGTTGKFLAPIFVLQKGLSRLGLASRK
jgi:radical SAM superfamily enzyme YgiQ (UPF0313 family)